MSRSLQRPYPRYGSIAIRAEIGAYKAQAYWRAVDAIVASLRDEPVTEDELNRARLPVVEALRRSQASNEYWLAELSKVTETPSDVDQTLSHILDLEAVMPTDIQRLARQYLKSDTAWRALVVSSRLAAPVTIGR